jgi:hypothetical protein
VIRVIYAVGVLALIDAGLLLGLCGVRWQQGVSPEEQERWISPVERLRTDQKFAGGNLTSTPLVEQAEAFALRLNPPKPPVRMETPVPVVTAPPVPRPPSPTPQFKLLAISHYRSHPEMSLAMIWDAGKGGIWVRKGDHLGHFVVERIEKDAIYYRDGDQLHQMAITIGEPAQLARLKSEGAASSRNVAAHEVLVIASQ